MNVLKSLRDKYASLSDVKKTALWHTFCNVAQRGASVITTPIFTRLLTTGEYGLCSVYLAWFEIFLIITSLNVQNEGLNNGLIRFEHDKDGFTSASAGLAVTMTLCWAGVYLLLRPQIDALTGLSSFVMLFMFIELIFNPPLYLWINRNRYDFRYRRPTVVMLLYSVLYPVVAIAAVLHTQYRAEARIISIAGFQGVFGCFFLFWLLYRGRKFYDAKYWKFAFTFNLPLVLYHMSQTLLNRADSIMINYYTGTADAGVYNVAYTAATLSLLVVSGINGSFNPWMYRRLKEKNHRELGRQALNLCVLVALGTVALTAFAPDIIRILATGDYVEAQWIIPPVSASVFFIFTYMIFANVEMYLGETRFVSLITVAGAGLNVVLNAVFIRLYGYIAAGWTTLVCYALIALWHYVYMLRACRRHGVEAPIFRGRALMLLSLGVLAATFVMLLVYRLGYVRYAVIAAAAAVVWLMRGRLVGALGIRRGE